MMMNNLKAHLPASRCAKAEHEDAGVTLVEVEPIGGDTTGTFMSWHDEADFGTVTLVALP